MPTSRPNVACCNPFTDPRGRWLHQKVCTVAPLQPALFDTAPPERAAVASHVERAKRQSGECFFHPGEPAVGCWPCSEKADRDWKERVPDVV